MASSQKLTNYEQKRLDNIRRNQEMVVALKIHSKATELSSAASSKRQRVVTKSFKASSEEKRPKTQSPIEIRRSFRIRGMLPEYKHSPPRGFRPISMRDAFRKTGSCSGSGSGSDELLLERILGVSKKTSHEKEELGGGNSIKGECLGLELGSRSRNPENIARVVPGRIMDLRFLPCSNATMIVVRNNFGNVGFWDVDSEDDVRLYLYHPHASTVSGISMHQHYFEKIFTSCYLGFIRLMDVEKEIFDLVYSSEDPICSLSQRSDDVKCLYFSEGYGRLNIWDERVRKCSTQSKLHAHRINSIDFNTQNYNIMATSSSDGTAAIWDLRSIKVDQPRLLEEVGHDKAMQSAYFSPSGSSLVTTSMDDTVGIVTGVNFEHTSMIKHNNQARNWTSSFKAIRGWDDSYIFIGNMERGVDVISPTQKGIIFTLQSPHMSAVPSRFDAHPYNVGMLAGATNSGQVYMWTLG